MRVVLESPSALPPYITYITVSPPSSLRMPLPAQSGPPFAHLLPWHALTTTSQGCDLVNWPSSRGRRASVLVESSARSLYRSSPCSVAVDDDTADPR